MSALLVAENLVRHYRVRRGGGLFSPRATLKAVDGVSFRIPAGRTLGLVGESGCGKSTTARVVLGLAPLTAGSISFKGEPIAARQDARWRAQRKHMQMVYQDPLGALDRRLRVGRQIVEPLVIHGIGDADERRRRLLALAEAVGLRPDHLDRYPHELSGGQRQRVVLARALILEPQLLVCDEPVSALDVSIQAQVVNLLQELQGRFGVAYLFISHDLKVVRQVSHEVAVMYLGRIVEQGEPDQLFANPRHPYTRALVAAIPVARTKRRREQLILAGDPPNPVDVPSGCAFRTRCPWAQPLCAARVPALKPLPDGHLAACHLAHGELPTTPAAA
jgi:peptide/nickel transport system ATP-binding protein